MNQEIKEMCETLALTRMQLEIERALHVGWTPYSIQLHVAVGTLENKIFQAKTKIEPGKLAF